MNMPTNKPSLKEKLYQETMFHEGDPEQSVFPDAVSMDTANQRIKLAIEKTEAEAYVDAIKNYPLMKKWEEEVIRADTTEQIFKKLNEMTIKVSHDVVYLDTRKLLELEKEFKMDK